MSERPAYERDPYLQTLDTEVVEVGEDGGAPWAALADTILYPEGGGQPADRGWLGEVAVVDVRKTAGAIRNVLAAPVGPGPVILRLDWARRFDHMQQHTAQHLLTAIALERHGWRTTAFHLGESVSDIELDVPALSRLQLDALEEEVAAEVRAARPVRARRVTEAEVGSLPVRSRGLPEGFAGDIRLVEIEGLDLNTCGGTHVRSTAELEAVALLGTEPMRGGTRLHFVAGGRLRRRLAGHEARNAAIKAVLDAPEGEFVTLVQRRKDELRDAERRLRALAEELAAAQAEALAGRPGALVDAHFDGRDPAFLGTLARRLATLAPAKLAFLTATNEAGSYFVLTGGEQVTADVQALGRQVAESLGGRGGGSARLFQGKAASLAARGAALATLRAAVPA